MRVVTVNVILNTFLPFNSFAVAKVSFGNKFLKRNKKFASAIVVHCFSTLSKFNQHRLLADWALNDKYLGASAENVAPNFHLLYQVMSVCRMFQDTISQT